MNEEEIESWNQIMSALRRAEEQLLELALDLGITPEANDVIKNIMEKKNDS